MSAKYSFRLSSEERQRALPGKIIIGQHETETMTHVVLRLLGFVLFYRDRIEIEGDPHNDSIPFKPDLLALDYEMRPQLWVECGECGASKLHKLAVKVPEAEIWVLKRSPAEAEALYRAMERDELRRNRYQLVGFDPAMFDELCGLVGQRNEFAWYRGGFDPAIMQFEFNGLWFDTAFTVLKF